MGSARQSRRGPDQHDPERFLLRIRMKEGGFYILGVVCYHLTHIQQRVA